MLATLATSVVLSLVSFTVHRLFNRYVRKLQASGCDCATNVRVYKFMLPLTYVLIWWPLISDILPLMTRILISIVLHGSFLMSVSLWLSLVYKCRCLDIMAIIPTLAFVGIKSLVILVLYGLQTFCKT